MIEGTAKILKWHQSKRGTITYIIYLPAAVSSDSKFPFKAGDKVAVQIQGRKLIIGVAV